MNPLDAISPNITDEKLAEFYDESFMDLVRDDYPISAVRNDDKIWAHQWFTDLMRQIAGCDCENKIICDCLSDWDRIPAKLSNLLAEVKRLREQLAHYEDNCTIVWMPEDVLTLDDTLTEEQVSEVLYMMEQKHDASLGITWDTISFWIDEVKE